VQSHPGPCTCKGPKGIIERKDRVHMGGLHEKGNRNRGKVGGTPRAQRSVVIGRDAGAPSQHAAADWRVRVSKREERREKNKGVPVDNSWEPYPGWGSETGGSVGRLCRSIHGRERKGNEEGRERDERGKKKRFFEERNATFF